MFCSSLMFAILILSPLLSQVSEGSEFGCTEETAQTGRICVVGTDSCTTLTGDYSAYFACSVLPNGDSRCFCLPGSGYFLNEDTGGCDNQINECECTVGTTTSNGCDQLCTDLDPLTAPPGSPFGGRFVCSCNAGWELDSANLKICNDIDECTVTPNICGPDNAGLCSNEVGSYTCTCNSGFQKDAGGVNCEDIDECAAVSSPCGQICTNSPGSYSCSCNVGYTPTEADPSQCEDIDECATETDNCDDVCQNSEGSFSCACNGDYILQEDGFTCVKRTCPDDENCELNFYAKIVINEYWSRDLEDSTTESYMHASKSLEEQFRAGFELNDRGWVLLEYELLDFTLKTSQSYYANTNFTVQDEDALIDGMTSEAIGDVIIAGLNQLDVNTFSAPISVDYSSLKVVTNEDESSNYHLTCLDSGMLIRIHEAEFDPEPEPGKLSLSDPSCQFAKTGEFWQTSFNYLDCGVEREEFAENGTILYTQFVMLGDTEVEHFPDSNLGYVNAAAHIKTLECHYRQSEVVRTEVETFEDSRNSAVGSFDVQLLIYTDDTYGQIVVEYPYYVESDNVLIAFEAKLDSGDTDLKIYLEECWAAPSDDIYDPDQVNIMNNGCSNDEDFNYMWSGFDSHWVRFTYVAHKFVNLSRGGEALESAYYYCYYELCDYNERECKTKMDGWEDKCTDVDARKRRSVPENNMNSGLILAYVAFLPTNATSEFVSGKDDDMLLGPETLAVFLAIVLLLTVVLLTSLVFILRFTHAGFARCYEKGISSMHSLTPSSTDGSASSHRDFQQDIPRLKENGLRYM